MSSADRERLGKRARQVFDLLSRRGALSAADVWESVPDLPSYSAARAVLRVLEDKGLATHSRQGSKFIYQPTEAPDRLRRSALRHLVDTLFSGSVSDAMQTLVDVSGDELASTEVAALKRLIDRAERRDSELGSSEGSEE